MLRYIIHRLLLMIPTLLGVAVLVFFLLRLMPGDPVQMMMEGANVSQARASRPSARGSGSTSRSSCSSSSGSAALLTGDFGVSMWTGRPVLYEIGIRLELSLQVAIMATILAVLHRDPARHAVGDLQGHLDRSHRARRSRSPGSRCRRSGSA